MQMPLVQTPLVQMPLALSLVHLLDAAKQSTKANPGADASIDILCMHHSCFAAYLTTAGGRVMPTLKFPPAPFFLHPSPPSSCVLSWQGVDADSHGSPESKEVSPDLQLPGPRRRGCD